jgi:hypothetical protein
MQASVESCGIEYTNSYTDSRVHNDSTLIPQWLARFSERFHTGQHASDAFGKSGVFSLFVMKNVKTELCNQIPALVLYCV